MTQLPDQRYPLYRWYQKNLQPLVDPAYVDESARDEEWTTGQYKEYARNERIDAKTAADTDDDPVLDALRSRESVSFPAASTGISKPDLFSILSCGYREQADGTRPVPSAGELYPLEIYPIVVRSADVEPGIYHYNPGEHALETAVERATGDGDSLDEFIHENWFHLGANHDVSVMSIVTGIPSRSAAKYGERGYMFTLIEAGCLLQSLHLAAGQHASEHAFTRGFSSTGCRNCSASGSDPASGC